MIMTQAHTGLSLMILIKVKYCRALDFFCCMLNKTSWFFTSSSLISYKPIINCHKHLIHHHSPVLINSWTFSNNTLRFHRITVCTVLSYRQTKLSQPLVFHLRQSTLSPTDRTERKQLQMGDYMECCSCLEDKLERKAKHD